MLSGVRMSIVKCMSKWIEDQEQMPKQITNGKMVLVPKTEKLHNEKGYYPVMCLNTFYKIFTGMVSKPVYVCIYVSISPSQKMFKTQIKRMGKLIKDYIIK